MDLNKIIAIPGKSGLFKIIGQSKNAAIVESLIDKKRFPAYASDRISSLEEIKVFTNDGDIPLKDVFKKIFEKQSGNKAINSKSDNEALKTFFEETVPDYDKERVYVSDMKKMIGWYNILFDNGLLVFTDEEEKKESDEGETKTEENALKPKQDTAHKLQPQPMIKAKPITKGMGANKTIRTVKDK